MSAAEYEDWRRGALAMLARCAPTPWRVGEESCGGRNIVDANGRVIATVIQRDTHPAHGRGITQAECDMIADLMASAGRTP